MEYQVSPEQISILVGHPLAHEVMESWRAGTLSEITATQMLNEIVGK